MENKEEIEPTEREGYHAHIKSLASQVQDYAEQIWKLNGKIKQLEASQVLEIQVVHGSIINKETGDPIPDGHYYIRL